MILDKKLLRKIDVKLLLAVTAIVIISLVVIGSATHINNPTEERYWFVQRQGIFAIINVALAVFLIKWEPHTRDFSRELGDQASQRI